MKYFSVIPRSDTRTQLPESSTTMKNMIIREETHHKKLFWIVGITFAVVLVVAISFKMQSAISGSKNMPRLRKITNPPVYTTYSSPFPFQPSFECHLTPDHKAPISSKIQDVITSTSVAISHLRSVRQVTTDAAFAKGLSYEDCFESVQDYHIKALPPLPKKKTPMLSLPECQRRLKGLRPVIQAVWKEWREDQVLSYLGFIDVSLRNVICDLEPLMHSIDFLHLENSVGSKEASRSHEEERLSEEKTDSLRIFDTDTSTRRLRDWLILHYFSKLLDDLLYHLRNLSDIFPP